jgi:hypothetical protein
LLNDPSLIHYEVVRLIGDTSKIYSVSSDSSKTEIIAWGICKKGELYKYHDHRLIPIGKYGSEFIISDYIDKANRRNRGLFVGAFVGGVVGAIIADSETPKLFSVTSIPYITKRQPEASVIDMKTGEFTFLP